MAGQNIKGFAELASNLDRFSQYTIVRALEAAQAAAAKVVQDAVEAAAPVSKSGNSKHPSGQLKSNVKIFTAKSKLNITGSQIQRVLIGPSKKQGFYGFFVEKGWNWSRTRRKRIATATTHSQSGTTESHKIEEKPWFPDQESLEQRAFAAGEIAFWQVINSEMKG